MLLTWSLSAGLFVIGLVIYLFFYTQWRRRRVAAQPFPQAWDEILAGNMALYRSLPPPLRIRLQQLMLIFLDEKRFYGCDGLVVTETMRLIIAAHACLLILNRGMSHYDQLRSILVYPSAYRAQQQIYDLGVSSRQEVQRLGESWHQGKVILSWRNVLTDSRQVHEGENVTLHEFSHQLDQVNGAADGLPVLTSHQSIKDWARVFEKEFKALQEQVDHHQYTNINPYGAQNPAEFFAVVTEAFFTAPAQLHKQHPELFDQLREYFQLDPLSWQTQPQQPVREATS